MAVPTITITGKLQDTLGGISTGSLRVTLCVPTGTGQPRIAGTSIVVDLDVPVSVDGSGNFTFTPWGVDVMLPGPNVCYYAISFKPSSGGTVKVINYQFTGSGSFDLSSLTPFGGGAGTPAAANAVITNPPGTQIVQTFALVSRIALPINPVTFSATPVFDANLGTRFDIILTGNVTSSTLVNSVDGEIVVFDIKQDGTGGRTFTWPASFIGSQSIDPGINARSIQAFQRIGASFYPLAEMTVN